MALSGVLNVLKPPGPTSFQVVARIRRLSGVRRVGHAGTLDPLAQGVLPVCLGLATKITPLIMELPKTYRAQIELGVTTDTYDAAGKVLLRRDTSSITREMVEGVLGRFKGTVWQRPPPYSAVKLGGKPLYSLARAGILVESPPRQIQVYSLEIVEWQPPLFSLRMECGKGTYVRSLAYDLGEILGCGAFVRETFRISYGPFLQEEALPLPVLEEALARGDWTSHLHPVDWVLSHITALTLSPARERLLRRGGPLPVTAEERPGGGERRRAYSSRGQFLGLLVFRNGQWQVERNFPIE